MILPLPLVELGALVSVENAMRNLVVPMRSDASSETLGVIEAMDLSPVFEALAWLYLDDLERAHEICQAMPDTVGANLHAIVHRREGDFSNALYWYRRAGLAEGEGASLTRAIEAGDRSEAAVERQRAEWSALAAHLAA